MAVRVCDDQPFLFRLDHDRAGVFDRVAADGVVPHEAGGVPAANPVLRHAAADQHRDRGGDGLVQEFQFGMDWGAYSRLVGNIFGAPRSGWSTTIATASPSPRPRSRSRPASWRSSSACTPT